MAKTFDPSSLSAADQQAFADWRQQLQQYVVQNGYIQSHPELKEGYDIVSGANLPPTVKAALKGYHPTWGKAGETPNANMTKDRGLWNNWETWLQIGLGGAVAAPVVLPALGVGGAAAGTTAGTTAATGGATAGTVGAGTAATAAPALGGGTTLAANLGGAGALGAGGAGATAAGTGGALASTGTTGVMSGYPSAGAGINSAAAGAGTSSWWKDLLGISSKADAARTAANLAGNYLQSRQVDKAVQAQVDAANKALDLQSNVYQQQRADLAPYRNVGSASIGELSRLVGLPAGSDTTTPYFQQQAAAQQATAQQNQQAQNRQPPAAPSQAVPRGGTISGLGDGFVNMVSPDGRPARVPQAQVNAALQAGGRMA